MAQRVQVLLTDDLNCTDIPAGKGETIPFALDGKTYEIDLTTKNSNALRKALAPYLHASRPFRNSRGRQVKRTQGGRREPHIKE